MSRCVKVMPCLDLREGRVVKGVQFEGLRDAGDPEELAKKYASEGADAIAFLEVSGTQKGREHLLELLRAVAPLGVPVLAGGGVDSVESAEELIDAGATQISVSSAAVKNPELVDALAARFGSSAVVISADVKTNEAESSSPRFEVTTSGGKEATGIDALAWLEEVERRGGGGIMLNSISTDGAQTGYDLDLIKAAKEWVSLPLIASGGAGELTDFVEGARVGAEVVLAASVFHFGLIEVPDVRDALTEAGFRECN